MTEDFPIEMKTCSCLGFYSERSKSSVLSTKMRTLWTLGVSFQPGRNKKLKHYCELDVLNVETGYLDQIKPERVR